MKRLDSFRLRASLGKKEVGRNLLAYLAAAFVVLQAVELFQDGLGLPDWVFLAAVAMLSAGLPIMAAIALIQGGQRDALRTGAEQPARHWLTLRRALLGGGVAFAGWGFLVGGYMGARALGFGPVGTLLAKGVLEAHDRIVFAEFEDRTKDPLLTQTVAEALAVGLSQSRVVRVVGRQEIEAALARMEKPPDTVLAPGIARELALREGIAVVVEGSLAPVGQGFLVSARLVSTADGAVLASLQERAEREDALLAAVDELAGRMRDRIGESLRVIRSDPPLAQVTTPSLVALRAYTQSKRVGRAEGDHEKQVALLEEALAADSAFAMAWHDLGWALRVENTPRASEAFTNAYRLREERLTERERYLATAAYHNWVTRDLAKAAAANETVLALDPNDSWVLNDLAILYDRLQNFARAEAMQWRAISADTANVMVRGGLVRVLANQGKFEEAEAAFQEVVLRAPNLPYSYMIESALAVASGDYARAERRMRALAQDHRDSPFQRYLSSWFIGVLEATQGRIASARQHFADAEATANSMGSTNLAFANAAQNATHLELLAGRPDSARVLLASALRRYPFDAMSPADRPYLEAAEMHARLGAPAAARRLVQAFIGAAIAEPADGALDHARGVIALTEGDATGAIEHLRASASLGCVICALPDLARAYEASGQIDSAMTVYARFVSVPMTDRLWATAAVHLGPTLERLAELHETRGERDEASGYAARLIELWEAADAELQPRVEAARQRITRLAPDRS